MALVFSERSPVMLVAKHLEVGDKFALVSYGDFGRNSYPILIFHCTVEKILKRDIVCRRGNGSEIRINQKQLLHNAYDINDEVLKKLKAQLHARIRAKTIKERIALIPVDHIMNDGSFMDMAETFINANLCGEQS